MDTDERRALLAANIVSRAAGLAKADPSELAGCELIDEQKLVVLDYQLESLTTSLARLGIVPNNGHFDAEDPDDSATSGTAARGQYFAQNHPHGWYDLADGSGPHPVHPTDGESGSTSYVTREQALTAGHCPETEISLGYSRRVCHTCRSDWPCTYYAQAAEAEDETAASQP